MADPNFAAVAETYAFGAKALDLFDLAYATNVDTPLENLRNDIEGDWAQEAKGGIDAWRNTAVAYMDPKLIRATLDPVLEQWADASAVKPTPGDPDANWREVYDYMVTNSQSLNRMEWTLGTPSAGGSNVGTATVARLATDEEGEPMESWWADTYTLECVSDYLVTKQKHTASWTLTGTATGPTGRPIAGATFTPEEGIPQHSDLTAEGLSNPSFDNGTFSGSTITALTGWTVGSSLSNFETNTTSTYIYLDTTSSGGTARSLRFVADDYVYQELQATGGFTVDDDTPYRFGVWLYRRDTATGTYTIRLTDASAPTTGGVSRAVTIGSLSDNAWTFIDLTATPGANNWPKGFRVERLCLTHQVASLATGTIYLDTSVQHAWHRVGAAGQAAKGRGCNGQYISILAGSTETIKGDLFTFTDSIGQTTVNQLRSGMNGAGYGYLPSVTGGTETVADK